MNVAEMKKNVKTTCHPITNIDAFIVRMLDRGQKVIASKHQFSWLRQYRYTLATVDSQEFYSLSPMVNTSKIIHIYDPTNEQHYGNMTEAEFRRYEPNPQSGMGYLYRMVGFSPVQNQPTASATITIVSDSASDTTQVVTIQGLNGDGIFYIEEATLNGLTDVTLTTACTKVLSLSKSAVTTGTVTVSATVGSTTTDLVSIAPSYRSISHPVIGIFNIPDAVNTLYYDFTMKLPTLSSDNHISLIPEQYHDAIELYAIHRVYNLLNNQSMSAQAFIEFQGQDPRGLGGRIGDMIADDYTPNGVWTLNSFETQGLQEARLPSMYPRGS